jgi:hypothetical protein
MLYVIAGQNITCRTDLIHKTSSSLGKCQSKGTVYSLLDLLIMRGLVLENEDKTIIITDGGMDLLEAVDFCLKLLEG